MGKAIVERGLTLEEVFLIVFSTWGVQLNIAATGRRLWQGLLVAGFYLLLVLVADVVGPNVIVGISAVAVSVGALLEPLAFHAGVTCHEVETDLYATLMRLLEKGHHVGVCAEAWVNLVEVYHVVASVKPSRLEARVYPQGVYAKALDIVEL